MSGHQPSPRIEQHLKRVLVIGGIGLLLSIAGAFVDSTQFFRSYLVAFVFWATIALGSLGLLMLQYLTGGMWGVLIRRPLESAAKTLPIVAVLFIPLLFGLKKVYLWANEEVVAHDHLLHAKSAYLNPVFFTVRAAMFFAIWIALAWLLSRWDREYEETGDPAIALKMRGLSAGGLVVLALTLTFASVDWVMSVDPKWFSTMFGISFMIGCLLSAMTFAISITVRMSSDNPIAAVVKPSHFRDLGNLTFAFTMLWAYTAFSQFLLIWYGNIKEEIPWYIVRSRGGWGAVALLLIVFHFFCPFFLLLLRDVKERARRLGTVVRFMLVMRAVDIFWIITPTFHEEGIHVHWLDVTTIIGLGGIWLFFFLRNLQKEPLLPMYEPQVQEALTHG